jgi:hypothetical protein
MEVSIMGSQLHKKYDDAFVKSIFNKYVARDLSVKQVCDILHIKKSRFFVLLNKYKQAPDEFSVFYKRGSPHRISTQLEKLIIHELAKEKRLIDNSDIPLTTYNYSYIRDQIYKDHQLKVSVPTIIKRAKEHNYYLPKKPRKVHDREIVTNYPGELIQHDSSFHRFSPYAEKKWYLITSLDDYSRYMLYAQLLEKESSWAHIKALENVMLNVGIPLSYYGDCHSIFRFVQGRDSIWRNHRKITDEVIPQWKQVLLDLNVNISYALSPQAKGKIERPYHWMQDRLVRTCARENIRTIQQAQEVLDYEVDRYNNRQVHSTTKEIPSIRFNNAVAANKTMFREFVIPRPYESTKDIFCLRTHRRVDAYHSISINNLKLRVKGVPLRELIELRIVPEEKIGISELRFWYKNKLVDIQKARNTDINIVQF